MKAFRKYLVYVYVPIMEKTFKSGTRRNCVTQQSIYVILRGNEETRRCINQVRNALRHIFFCYLKYLSYKSYNFELSYLFDIFDTLSK